MSELPRRVDGVLGQAVIWLHDIARCTRDQGVAAGLRRAAHQVSQAATTVRQLLRPAERESE